MKGLTHPMKRQRLQCWLEYSFAVNDDYNSQNNEQQGKKHRHKKAHSAECRGRDHGVTFFGCLAPVNACKFLISCRVPQAIAPASPPRRKPSPAAAAVLSKSTSTCFWLIAEHEEMKRAMGRNRRIFNFTPNHPVLQARRHSMPSSQRASKLPSVQPLAILEAPWQSQARDKRRLRSFDQQG